MQPIERMADAETFKFHSSHMSTLRKYRPRLLTFSDGGSHLSATASVAQPAFTPPPFRELYQRLADGIPNACTREEALNFLREALDECSVLPDELPADPADLLHWMYANAQHVHVQYQDYLDSRKQGGARRYFSNRSHALYFLRNVAPTKLVDGSWLYGLCEFSGNPRLSDLVLTYLEELGRGDPGKNHVALYRNLLAQNGIDPVDGLPDARYQQGLIQLCLGWNAQDALPEIVGFNLAYEQLPLHLLITAYELNELGLDPYYFSLHVTVDNVDTGHARRACQAALDAAPRIDDGGEYWRRVRAGAKLGNLGVSTLDIIHSFDLDEEVVRILANKAPAGHGAHSDYCKVAGRSVNDWLANPSEAKAFLGALEGAGWIKKYEPANHSRFWNLLQGERAEMFGVFSSYELQVIYDWIRGPSSADGAAYEEMLAPPATAAVPRRPISFRVAERLRLAKGRSAVRSEDALDADLSLFRERYAQLGRTEQRALLVRAMAPAMHWTPAGMEATRMFVAEPAR